MSAPLHPHGTLRARFEQVSQADIFRRLGVGARSCDLGDEGLYLAEELVAADVGWLGSSGHPEALAIVVLALMIAQRQGSTRLPLASNGPLRALVADIARVAGIELDLPRVMKTIANLTRVPRFNSVIGAGDARLPLVVDLDCLYTERARWLEQRVASRIAERLRAAGPAPDVVDRAVAAAGEGRGLHAAQLHAVRLALAHKIAVVTGGPGTGKTLVAAAIVRGFARLGLHDVALAAQTGKAANRLTEVLAAQLGVGAPTTRESRGADKKIASERVPSARNAADDVTGAAAAGGVDDAPDGDSDDARFATGSGPHDTRIPGEPPIAQTLHRLLGYRGGRFAHHALCPLPVDAVIVDEASMLDLELVDALLDALPVTAPLVLIGDAHQLPAIDAGQILADLTIEDGAAAAHVAVLSKSYRQDTADADGRAVYEAARAIHRGEVSRLFETRQPLAATRPANRLLFRGVELVDTLAVPRPHDATLGVADQLWHHFDGLQALRAGDRVFRFVDGAIDPQHEDELERLWRMLSRARILTATRALPTGSIAINDHVHDLALDRLSVTGRPDFVPGEPVIVTKNDYQRGLFNGDQGIVVRADEGLGRHHYRAVFRVGGVLRPFAIEALRDRLELAWALTVHKSQGSELDVVAMLLPHEDLPLITRELLYTGVTRARSGVVIAGARAILASGCKRRALRHSGLAERLRGA